MSQFVVGLTGGIGSGKSTIANLFANFKVDLVDADIIARQAVEPHSDALNHIIQHFGKSVLDATGQLNRQKLRNIIFNHADEKVWLDNLLHPIIRQQMQQQCLHAQSDYCLLIVPLLLENQLTYMTDRVLITDCWPQTQLTRAVIRDNNSAQLILNIMRKQISRKQRLLAADDIIDTELPFAQIQQVCLSLHQKYLELAKLKTLR